jgi:3-(3-hydroxy-phenyl)propionate hydroxylase
VKKAVRVGWAMTGGQDRAAAVRRIALAAAVRSERVCQAKGSTATPRLKIGALQRPSRRLVLSGIPAARRTGGLIPNPLVSAGDGPPARLDAILADRSAVLTARRTDADLVDFCRRNGLVLVRISSTPVSATPAGPGVEEDTGWTEIRLTDDAPPAAMRALAADPGLTVIVRPDRVVAAVQPRSRRPRLPWYIPAAAGPEHTATTSPAAHPGSVSPVTTSS